MCPPDVPQADTYDHNPQVVAHFTETPPLTRLTWDHKFHHVDQAIRPKLERLYREHNIKRGAYVGLYYAGTKKWLAYPDRDRTLVLVLEMMRTDIVDGKWRLVDGEVRELMQKYGLSGKHGVCVRYYTAYPPKSPPMPILSRRVSVQPGHADEGRNDGPWGMYMRQVRDDAVASLGASVTVAAAASFGTEEDRSIRQPESHPARVHVSDLTFAERLTRYTLENRRRRARRSILEQHGPLDVHPVTMGEEGRARSSNRGVSPSGALARIMRYEDADEPLRSLGRLRLA